MDDIKNLTSEQALKNLRAGGFTKQADAFEQNLKGITTVKADQIGNTTPNVPTPQPQKNTDLSLGVLSSGASMGNFQDITQEDILSQKAGLYTKVMDLLNQTKGESKRKGELLEDEGAFDIKKQITGYQNQLAAEERAFEVERRRLMENPEGVFGPGALQGQISNLESKSLQRRADIAILGNAASNNLQTALDIVDMKIDNEFGPAKEELNIFKQQLEFASPFLGEISSYLKDQADEKEKKIKEQQAWKKEILGLAVDAQQNGNTSLANRLVAMSNGEVTADTYSQAVSSAVAGGAYSPKAKTGTTIGVLDAQRYNEAFPGANITPGMTEAQANDIVANLQNISPDQKITNEINNLKTQDYTKAEAISAINSEITDPVIKRKALAEIERIYGTEKKEDEAGLFDKFKGIFSKKETKPITGTSRTEKGFAALSDYQATDLGFFQGLFKK